MIEKLRNIFVNETQEQLTSIESAICNCSYSDISKDIAHQIYTTAHNIKGTAPMVGINNLTKIVLPLEKVFAAVKNDQLIFSSEIVKNTAKIIPIIKAGLNNYSVDKKNQAESEKVILFFESLIK